MLPNCFHPASSSISWRQQQKRQHRNKGPLVPFPYNHHHHRHDPHRSLSASGEGTSLPSSVAGGISSHQPHLDLMDMDSTSSPTNPMNYQETEQIDDRLALGIGGSEGSDGRQTLTIEKEHMFDKVVTPSDVGKLNRLVIPKQHAEKYFPLDSSTNEKGLLLNFEDRNGNPWRFRYSYWNSSQSYVMTKGWSRFVKDKKLDAGDIVSFSRGVGELAKDRLFIDWRRRPDAPPLPPPQSSIVPGGQYLSFNSWNPHPYNLNHHQHQYHELHQSNSSSYSYGNSNPCPTEGSLIYFRSQCPSVPSAGGVGIGMIQMQRGARGGPEIGIEEEEPMVFKSVPVVQGKVAAKRLRLFGVNMDCPISEPCSDISDPPGIILSSTAVSHHSTASSMAANPQPQGLYPGHFSSSMMPPYNSSYIAAPLLQKMSSSDKMSNKNKGSLSLVFDV